MGVYLAALRTRTGKRYLIVLTLLALVACIAAFYSGGANAIPNIVFTAALLSHLGLYSIANRLAIVKGAARVDEINTRVRKIARTVGDTAGSAGRSAPLIREIHSSVVRTNGNSVVTTPARPDSSRGINATASDIPSVPTRQGEPRRTLKVFVIADQFTVDAFAPEWNQLLPTPKNWRNLMERYSPDLLFIESAWEGNNGAWKYQLVGKSAPRTEIRELILECKARGVPVALWNKEDPPHFHDFLPLARLVDHVFTTEASLVDAYMQELGHRRVSVLPFAAQPRMHNPAQPKGLVRDKSVVFGGMYFRDKYPERRQQMSFLLPAAARLSLDIYSRHFGGHEKYQFPAALHRYVKPPLPYPEMVGAYHKYKLVINVNSVPNSQSMCARRVFEATACGAAVISAPTPANEQFFPGHLVTEATAENEAYMKMRSLIRSEMYRSRLVHLAQRVIWENHTYRHRASEVLKHMGIHDSISEPLVSIFITTNRPGSVETMVQNCVRQSYENYEVVVLTHGFMLDEHDLDPLRSKGVSVRVLTAPKSESLGSNLNRLVDSCSGEYGVRMDDDDWYGQNYVRDMVNAIEYSEADLVGKAATYIYFEERNATVLTMPANEHKYTNFVRGATFAGPIETFKRFRFPDQGSSEDTGMLEQIIAAGGRIYSCDRFNFVVNRWALKERHTWRESDDSLFSTGEMAFIGDGKEQVSL